MKKLKLLLILSLTLTACGGETALVTPSSEIAQAPTIVVTPIPTATPSPTPTVTPSPSSTPSGTPYAFSGGNGTQANPYLLDLPSDVQHIKDFPAAYYRLNRNIDMTGFAFTPIGNFSGTLYGDNFEIQYLTITQNTNAAVALFNVMSGTLVQLKLYQATVSGLSYAAGFAVSLTGLISSCSMSGVVTSPSGGNGYNTGNGNPFYVSKGGAGQVIFNSFNYFHVTFNGFVLTNPDHL